MMISASRATNSLGRPTHHSCFTAKSLPVMDCLLSKGLDPFQSDKTHGTTLAHMSASHDWLDGLEARSGGEFLLRELAPGVEWDDVGRATGAPLVDAR